MFIPEQRSRLTQRAPNPRQRGALAATYYHAVRPHCRTDNDAIRTEAGSRVVENSSAEVITEMEFDRHILRITRGSVLNFLMLAIVLLFRHDRDAPLAIVRCI